MPQHLLHVSQQSGCIMAQTAPLLVSRRSFGWARKNPGKVAVAEAWTAHPQHSPLHLSGTSLPHPTCTTDVSKGALLPAPGSMSAPGAGPDCGSPVPRATKTDPVGKQRSVQEPVSREILGPLLAFRFLTNGFAPEDATSVQAQ